MPIHIAMILGVVLALAGTIAVCILVMPEKKRPTLNKFFQFLHDVFSFKSLLIEKILRVLYILTTLSCLFGGFLMLFSGYENWYGEFRSFALGGLSVMLVGPIAARLTFESLMMFILLVKNTIAINQKLQGAPIHLDGDIPVEPEQEPEPEPEPEPKMRFCTVCGTRYDANKGGCPNGCNPEE